MSIDVQYGSVRFEPREYIRGKSTPAKVYYKVAIDFPETENPVTFTLEVVNPADRVWLIDKDGKQKKIEWKHDVDTTYKEYPKEIIIFVEDDIDPKTDCELKLTGTTTTGSSSSDNNIIYHKKP